jgi:High potential iron-sulfur protein
LSKIARRKFIQLSAVAAAGCFVRPGTEAQAQDMPQLTEDDPMAVALKYTHDASSVDPAARVQPAADQTCANCAQLTGNEGDEWRPCNIFVGKVVNSKGWCSVWVPKG